MSLSNIKISATIICYNEANNIADCIASLSKVADELICIDSFSQDDTVSIAKSLGAKVIQNKFEGHIQQKNFALRHTSNEMVLSLDGDERLSEELIQSILDIKSNPTFTSYAMNRKNFFCGKWIRFGGWYPDRKIRLWNKSMGQWGGHNPHDKVILNPGVKTGKLDGDILHYSVRHKEDFPKQMTYFAEIGAQAYHQKGKTSNVFLMLLNPAFTFIKSFLLQGGFLDGTIGYFIAKHKALSNYKKYKLLRQL